MSDTFASLGCPFELYEADTDTCSSYRGPGHCSLCDSTSEVTFALGIGTDLIVACSACGRENGLDTEDRAAAKCSACAAIIAFPDGCRVDPRTCYACLRAGRAAFTHDTALGLVRWVDAIGGVTHGLPGLSVTGFELLPATADGWVGARVPTKRLIELVRTPTYVSWQGDCWHFCCGRPMTFLGDWGYENFSAYAVNGDGLALFKSSIDGDSHEEVWEKGLRDSQSWQMFRCSGCGRLKGNWDSD